MKAHEARVEEILIRQRRTGGYISLPLVLDLALAQLNYIQVLEAVSPIAGKDIPVLSRSRQAVREAMERI